MKAGTRDGLTLKTKREEKKAITEESMANLEFGHLRAVRAKLLPNGLLTDCTVNVYVNDMWNNQRN